MKRRILTKKTLGKGVALLLLTAFLVLPSLTVINWGKDLGLVDTRKAKPIAFQSRSIDKSGKPELFQEPLLSVTFDDGWGSVFTVAYPLLQKYGISTTQYVISGEFSDQQYMSKKQVAAMQKTGHEVGCHTVTHADLTLLGKQDLNKELAECKKVLGDIYGPVQDFASPYSSYNNTTQAAIRKYFRSQRNTEGDPTNGVGDPDVNSGANFTAYDLTSVTIHRDTSVQEIQDLINYSIAHNSWLILTYHAVDGGPSEYGLGTEKMERQLKAMSNSGIRIATIGQVLDEYQARNKR